MYDVDDDASEEGALMRGMFYSSSSSSSLSSTHSTSNESNTTGIEKYATTESHENINEGPTDLVTTKLYLGNILLAQQSIGGEIAQRLWPSASHLATFVLEFVRNKDEQSEDTSKISDILQIEIDLKKTSFELKEQARRQMEYQNLRSFFQDHSNKSLNVLELGAGVGLTGIKIATELPARVILTDLELALPFLHKNIELNADKFVLNQNGVIAKKLGWGTDDHLNVLPFFESKTDSVKNEETNASNGSSDEKPLLVLAADCVYFEELHFPLEKTLADILSTSANSSVCLIAAMRRTKRDTSFFKNLGKKTKTSTHTLNCTCIEETVMRNNTEEANENVRNRVVMRIYAIRWLPRSCMTPKKK